MFRQNTTLIVGAGASCELGLPSGDALKKLILNLLAPTDDNSYGFTDKTMIEDMKQRRGPNVSDHRDDRHRTKEAAKRIRKGLPLAPSIDNFLHSHQGDADLEQLGKLAIAISIIRAEGRSHLFSRISPVQRAQHPNLETDTTICGEELSKIWYPAFAQLLFSGVQRNNIGQAFKCVRFVIFNYDRCLEQYIWMALQRYFDINETEASEILSDVRFIHPYGYLGPLPWRSSNGTIAFGEAETTDLVSMAACIRTFTESVRSDIGGKLK